MRQDEKQIFDYLNQSSYLLRILFDWMNIDIQSIYIMNDRVWHVLYREAVIGTITFRTAEDDFTYCNIRLYKYIKQKIKDIPDFIMSEYYEFEDGVRVRFKFDKFEKYFNAIKEIIDQDESLETEKTEIHCNIEDSISRLTEYCEEYDQKFSKNMIIHDIMNVIKENKRLHAELQKKSETSLDTLLNT